ncbi:siderophore-iron reductase FhuF [Pseudomonas defluvii]|uniref:siderophore-iron reductase FhuF n=1 Tax=Pseudomonas defluvii TaxID=1876757 RepID=UPI00081130C8|nr:siderophore-iron reductase FhuF [Pseudomonas defluvii]
MIDVLAPLFCGELAVYAEGLSLSAGDQPVVSGRRFVEAEQLEQCLDLYAVGYPGADRRALASLWSKDYFLTVLPAVVASSLVLGWHLPVTLDDIEVVIDAQGLPARLVLPNPGERVAPDDAWQRFAPLIEGNLEPFIDALARVVKLSPRVLWSNAGNYVESIVGVLAERGFPTDTLAHGEALIRVREWPHGKRNRLFEPVRYVQMPGPQGPLQIRQRRQCCLRDGLPGYECCSDCPLISDELLLRYALAERGLSVE